MDHQDAADRASDELSVDLYSALIHGDPAAPAADGTAIVIDGVTAK